jgi:hypothetical protein
MNLRHPYEQLIADKLRKLPAPDANASWQQMKRLLDDDEDTKAGGGKRPPGSGWWRIGIIAIVLSTSLWLYVEKTTAPTPLAKNNTTAPLTADHITAETGNSSSKKTNTTSNHQTATIDNNTTLPVANATTAAKDNNKIDAATAVASNTKKSLAVNKTGIPPAGNTAEYKPVKTNHPENINTAAGSPAVKQAIAGNIKDKKHDEFLVKQRVDDKEKNTLKTNFNGSRSAVTGFTAETGSSNKKTNTAGLRSMDIGGAGSNKTEPLTGAGNNIEVSYTPGQHTGKLKHLPGKDNNNHSQQNGDVATRQYLPVNQPTGAEEPSWLETLSDLKTPFIIPSFNTSLSIGDSIASNRNTNNLLSNETKKAVVKAQRDKTLEDMSKKEKKSFHLDLSNLFKPFSLHMDADPRWAAGIALNSAITVNAQSRYNYNMNGKAGTLTDYIPSVYLQFHLNDYVYAQTEINFVSPQYTPQLLVYQQSGMTAQAGISQQKSIYIQKLYYFNVPLSLHYSPINNLYFSAGLQFSSFQSGLVSIQTKQYTTLTGADHPSNISNSIVKFRDDSIAAKLSPNEWRWQAGAEYYWNRFTVGLRYNRSFKNLLNVDLSGSLPPTPLRNESLLLSIRYNLFESRKKGEPSQKN